MSLCLLMTLLSGVVYRENIVVASFTEIKTGYRGFEMKRNLVFRMLVLCMENYLQEYMSDNLQMEVAFARYY